MHYKLTTFWTLILFLLLWAANSKAYGTKYEISPVSDFTQSGIDSEVHLKDFTRLNLDNFKLYPWFKHAYQDYKPDIHIIDSLSLLKDHVSIIVFGGSWCSDTQNLLPKFYKSVENAKFAPDKITLIGVDRDKYSGDRRSRKYRLKRVPTFILFYDGKEVGRVVESVNHSIESDMLAIYHKAGH